MCRVELGVAGDVPMEGGDRSPGWCRLQRGAPVAEKVYFLTLGEVGRIDLVSRTPPGWTRFSSTSPRPWPRPRRRGTEPSPPGGRPGHQVDTADFAEGEEVYFFSHRGTPLKAAPTGRAITAFHRHVARNPEFYPAHPQNKT